MQNKRYREAHERFVAKMSALQERRKALVTSVTKKLTEARLAMLRSKIQNHE